jgi:hypothetical protein
MLISQPAFLCLHATWQRVVGRPLLEEVHRAPVDGDANPIEARAALSPSSAPLQVDSVVGGTAHGIDYGLSAAEPSRTADPNAPLSAHELRARAAALRALALSRGRRFDAAQAAFAEAARLDPSLDLTRTPGFWKLERGAHEAAIDAYVEVGRAGDAAVLRARVHSTYRPKAIRARPGPVLSS